MLLEVVDGDLAALGIYEFEGNIQLIGEGSFINVTLGEGCYVG